jgi:alkylation response protein AidB-like acyl-CoA dehydrogenase
LWDKLAEFGLFGLTIGEKYGGLNEDFLTAAVAYEALGYGCADNGLTFAATNHVFVALNLIYLYGSDFLKEKYIAKMMSGEWIGAFTLTEAQSGSDAFALSMNARKEGGSYILNGSKMFVSNGTIADVFIVAARVEDGKFACFVVEKLFPGVSVGKEIEKMGLESCPFSEVTLQNCIVPEENVLGSAQLGYGIVTAALEWERIYEFAPHVGAMRRVLERCIKYANERIQYKQPISAFQAVSHKIADMKLAVETARLLLYKAAWLKDQKKSAFLEASMFKLYTSENYIKICKDALQIFGAYGYCKEYGIERELRDALACSIYSGTSEIQRNTIYQLCSR